MTTKIEYDRELWLYEASTFIIDDIIAPHMAPDWEPLNPYRVSVGFPPRTRANTKVIAVCIVAEASADKHNEIFVSPTIDDSIDILGALTHELIHYADNCASGHKNHFARLARLVGLEGKLTATTAGADLQAKLKKIVKLLGCDIPHAKLDLGLAKAKQSTRMLKIECIDTECGFNYRASATQIAKIQIWECPACEDSDMHAV